MTPRFNSRLQTILLIASALTISACATTKPDATVSGKTDQATRTVVEKGKLETPTDLKPSGKANVTDPVKTSSEATMVPTQSSDPNKTRVNSREQHVNARTAPSTRSRVVAVLKQGQEVEVLDKKHGWLKIKWQHNGASKHGWINKSYVEGFEK